MTCPLLSAPSKMASADWQAVLEAARLDAALAERLSDLTLAQTCQCALEPGGRVGLLAALKDRLGTSASLAQRQALASAISKHAKEQLGLPVAAAAVAAPSTAPLTIAGKTDGFGAQLMAQFSGIAFCRGMQRSPQPNRG